MSGCLDSKPCPVCGQDMDVYTDYKPFDTVNMNCIHCGFYGYVKCGMECDEDRKASFLAQAGDEADFEPLTKEQRKEYLAEFKSLCGNEISAEGEALYLGLPYNPANKVVIAVRGGVADIERCPAGVEVEIRDYDNQSEEPDIRTVKGVDGNSVRDQVKNILRGHFEESRGKCDAALYEIAAECADEIFNTLLITPEQQDEPF